MLVPLAGVCATVAVGSGRGPVRTCALTATAILVLWTALVLVAVAFGPLSRLRGRYLDRRYGAPVLLATRQRIVDGESLWSWTCPHCRHRNDGTSDCERCRAVFDGCRYRVKRAL